MQITTDAYSALGEPLPSTTYTVVSNFPCDFDAEEFPEKMVRGLFVKGDKPSEVIPIYLSQSQLDAIARAVQ